MHHRTDRMVHTHYMYFCYTSCGALVKQGIFQWVHHERCDGSLDRSFMVDPLSYFLLWPVLHDWCNKGCGMYYPVCGMMHIKEPLLLIAKK